MITMVRSLQIAVRQSFMSTLTNYTTTRKIRILWRPELYSIQQKYHLPEYKQVSGTGESNLHFILRSDTGFLSYSIPYSFRSFS